MAECQIRKKGASNADLRAPFGCSVSIVDTGDKMTDDRFPRVKFAVGKKPTETVTDFVEASRILNEHCAAGEPECSWTATEQVVKQAQRSKWQIWGTADANCISKPTEDHTVSNSHTIAWTDTFGVKGSAKFDIKIVEASVEVSYSHAISDSYTYSESHTQKIPFGRVGAFYLQPGYVEITGDFEVGTNDKVYLINSFTFDMPIGEEIQPKSGGPRVEPVILKSMDIGSADCSGSQSRSPLVNLPEASAPPDEAVELAG